MWDVRMGWKDETVGWRDGGMEGWRDGGMEGRDATGERWASAQALRTAVISHLSLSARMIRACKRGENTGSAQRMRVFATRGALADVNHYRVQGLVDRFAPQQRTNYVALLNEWAVGFYTELDFQVAFRPSRLVLMGWFGLFPDPGCIIRVGWAGLGGGGYWVVACATCACCLDPGFAPFVLRLAALSGRSCELCHRICEAVS
eukprot:3505055-Rhodomonas_salina.2